MVKTYDAHAADAALSWPAGLPADPALVSAPAANAPAVVTIPAQPGRPIILTQVFPSYSASPTAGSTLTITDGGTTIFSAYISALNQPPFTFEPPLCGTPNQAMTITLAAGGSGISGALNVNAHLLL